MSCCLKGNEKKHICIIPPLLYYFLIYIFFDIVSIFRFYQIKFWIKFTSGLLVHSYVVPNKSSLSQAWKTRKLFLSQRLVWFSYKAISHNSSKVKRGKVQTGLMQTCWLPWDKICHVNVSTHCTYEKIKEMFTFEMSWLSCEIQPWDWVMILLHYQLNVYILERITQTLKKGFLHFVKFF